MKWLRIVVQTFVLGMVCLEAEGQESRIGPRTDSTPYAYLRVESRAPGLWGEPGVGFKYSADGHNFYTLSTNGISWTDTTPLAQCFTPAVLYWNGNFWTAYDIFANQAASSTTTNRTGLVRSPDLINFTNVGPVILPTANNAQNWGQRWYLEGNQPYLTFANNIGGAHQCYVTHPLDANMATWSTPILLINNTSAYDLCVVKSGSTYYGFVAGASAAGNIDVYTNSTLTTQFTLYKTNLFVGTAYAGILEGPCVIPIANGGWRMYTVGDPGDIAKGYYSESTGSLTNWSTPVEINEDGDISDNGSVLTLGKSEANATQLAQLSKVYQGDKEYDVLTTNGTPGVGLTNRCPAQGSVYLDYVVVAYSSIGQSAMFHLAVHMTADNLFNGNDTLVGSVRVLDRVRPNASWQCYPTNNNNGTYLQFIGPSSSVVIRWHVHQRIESTIAVPAFANSGYDPSAEPTLFSTVQTNFVGGLKYTNLWAVPIQVSCTISNVVAAVAGSNYVQLQISGAVTNWEGQGTFASTVAATNAHMLMGFVPAGSTYLFTNQVSGAGNAAAIVPGSGQIMVY